VSGGEALRALTVGRGRHLLGLSLSGGEVHHQDPLRLMCGLLADELASPWHYPLLGGGLPSTGLRLLPPVTSLTSLEREAYCHPWGNRRRGLSGLSERSAHAAPSGRGEAKATLPA
jgi:hypothetical protein